MLKQQDNSDVQNERDDVFEETAEHRIKIEKEQDECEDNFETLREVVEGELESNSSNLNDDDFCNINKRNSSSHIIKRPAIKSCTANKKLYYNDIENNSIETESCLNDEEPDDVFDEEREKETAGRVTGFERIVTEIKMEIDEENDAINSQENFNYLTNFVKQENITDHYIHDDNPLQKPFNNLPVKNMTDSKVLSLEDDGSCIQNEGPRIDRSIFKNLLSSLKMGKNANTVNKLIENENIPASINNDSQNIHVNVEDIAKRVEYITKELQTKKDDGISKQNDEKEANKNTETTERGKRFKVVENANKAPNNKQHSNRNNEHGKNIDQSCCFDNTNQTELESKSPEVNKNSYRKLSLQNIFVNIDNSEKVQEDSFVATMVASKENHEDITESKKKNLAKAGRMETNVNTELQELSNKLVNKCCQTQTETLLEIGSINVDEKQTELSNTNTHYICKRCPFEAKRKSVMNRHLLKRGTEFSSTIMSFFDVIKKAKLYTSQLEQIYDEKELQIPIIIKNNQHDSEGTNKYVNNDVQFETECFADDLNNALRVENVEVCTNVLPRRRNAGGPNYTPVNEKRDEGMNTENESLYQIKSKNKIIGKLIKRNYSFESDQFDKDDEVVEVNCESNPSLNMEYSCITCTFKTKRRALLRRHLLTHGNELASGIITFLDLVEKDKIFPIHFRENSEVKEEQTHIIGEDIETENKVDILDNKTQSAIDGDAKSRCEKKLENEGKSCKIVPFNEGALPLNNTNVDNKSENIENIVNENERMELPGTNKAKLKLRKKGKRKGAVRRGSLPIKKIKMKTNDEMMYSCDECSYRSIKKKNFNEHKVIHTKNIIKCNQCQFITNLKKNLTSHMLVHLKPEEVKLYKCPHCPYQTKRNSDLHIHKLIHKKPEEIKILQCDKCPYQSKRKSNLKSHQLIHKSADEVTLFSCAMCSFRAKMKCSLKKHVKCHQKDEI